MAGRLSNEEGKRIRSIVLQYLKDNSDCDGYSKISCQAFALDRGIPYYTVRAAIEKLSDEGKIEYARTGNGFIVRMIDIPNPLVIQVKDERPLRKCDKCGTFGPNPNARFCWKCGASLLSDRELLKEAFDRVFPKIAKLSTDSAEMNEIMTVIGKVGKMAFEEVSVSA